MQKKRSHLVILLLAAWAVVHLSGCSVLGFLMGASLDSSIPEKDVFTLSQVDSIKRGRTITVLRTDGTTVSGECAGSTFRPDEKYAETYTQQTMSSPIGKILPAMGDSLVCIGRIEQVRYEFSGHLIGFSAEALRLQSKEYRSGVVNVLLEYIDTLYSAHGSSISGETVRGYVADGTIPLIKKRLLVSRERDTTFVPIDSIAEVWSTNSHSRKWVGFGIGAAIDGTIIYAFREFTGLFH